MTKLTCEQARAAIEARRFTGWSGLPDACTPSALIGAPSDGWVPQTRGTETVAFDVRHLTLGGYERATVTRDDSGHVVMFDGSRPDLDGGWPALQQDLGAPEAQLDYRYLFVDYAGGEWVYPSRGITVFVNPQDGLMKHIAVYPSTTLDDWTRRLRPTFEAKRSPRRGGTVPSTGQR